MTVKELIALLQTMPQDAVVEYEYEGPDACTKCDVRDAVNYDANHVVLIDWIPGQG